MDMKEYSEIFRDAVKNGLLAHKGKSYLVANRQLAGSFYHTFADAMFEYEVGVILLERFYIKEKAESTNLFYKKLSEEDLQLSKEIREELQSILKEHVTDVGDMSERQKRIDELDEKSKQIKVEAAQIEAFRYKNVPLVSFDLYTDEDIDALSDLCTAFAINATLFLGMQTLMNYDTVVSTIDHGDYIDLILIPAHKKEQR